MSHISGIVLRYYQRGPFPASSVAQLCERSSSIAPGKAMLGVLVYMQFLFFCLYVCVTVCKSPQHKARGVTPCKSERTAASSFLTCRRAARRWSSRVPLTTGSIELCPSHSSSKNNLLHTADYDYIIYEISLVNDLFKFCLCIKASKLELVVCSETSIPKIGLIHLM